MMHLEKGPILYAGKGRLRGGKSKWRGDQVQPIMEGDTCPKTKDNNVLKQKEAKGK